MYNVQVCMCTGVYAIYAHICTHTHTHAHIVMSTTWSQVQKSQQRSITSTFLLKNSTITYSLTMIAMIYKDLILEVDHDESSPATNEGRTLSLVDANDTQAESLPRNFREMEDESKVTQQSTEGMSIK